MVKTVVLDPPRLSPGRFSSSCWSIRLLPCTSGKPTNGSWNTWCLWKWHQLRLSCLGQFSCTCQPVSRVRNQPFPQFQWFNFTQIKHPLFFKQLRKPPKKTSINKHPRHGGLRTFGIGPWIGAFLGPTFHHEQGHLNRRQPGYLPGSQTKRGGWAPTRNKGCFSLAGLINKQWWHRIP